MQIQATAPRARARASPPLPPPPPPFPFIHTATESTMPPQRGTRRRAAERRKTKGWDMYAALTALGPLDPAIEALCKRIRLKIHNVVSTAKLGPQIPNMSDLAWCVAGSENKFASPVHYVSETYQATATAQVNSGSLNVTGPKCQMRALLVAYDHAILCTERFNMANIDVLAYEAHNMQGTWAIDALIDLRALNAAVPMSVYNPRKISHCSIVIDTPRVTVLVYPYGRVVTCGAKTVREYEIIERDFGRFLMYFACPGATRDAHHRQMVVRMPIHGGAVGDATAAAPTGTLDETHDDAHDTHDAHEADDADTDTGSDPGAPIPPKATKRQRVVGWHTSAIRATEWTID